MIPSELAMVLLGLASGYAAAGPAAGRDRWYRVGLAWPLGAGFLALLVLLLPGDSRGLARVGWVLCWLVAAALAVAALVRSLPARPEADTPLPGGGSRFLWSAMLAVVVVEIVVLAASVVLDPRLTDWDAWAIWGMKARAFAAERSVDPYLRRVDWYEFSWPDRPCLPSLVAAAVALPGGEPHDGAIRTVHLLWFASLLVLFQRALRRVLPPGLAMVYTAALATTPNLAYHATAGLGNLPLGCYLFASLDALDRWRRAGAPGLVVTAAVLCGCAALTRDEGIVLVAVLLACLALQWARLRARGALVALTAAAIASVAGYGAWRAGLAGRETVWSLWLERGTLARLGLHWPDASRVVSMIAGELFSPAEQMEASPLEQRLGLAVFWPAFLATTVAGLPALKRHSLAGPAAAVTAVGLLAFSGGLWLFPYQDLADLAQNWAFALDRHLVALAPMAACAIACSHAGPFADSAISPDQMNSGGAGA